MEHIHLINELIKQMNKYNLPLWMTLWKTFISILIVLENQKNRMRKIQVQFTKHIYVNEIFPRAVVWYNAYSVCIKMTRGKEVWNKVISLLRFS